MDSIKADHGFNMDSKSVRNLLYTMSELDPQQRRDFLQFVTGSPKLPIGGTTPPGTNTLFLSLTLSFNRFQKLDSDVHGRVPSQ
jgi:HECT-domain (ubiquitin-transferase)